MIETQINKRFRLTKVNIPLIWRGGVGEVHS